MSPLYRYHVECEPAEIDRSEHFHFYTFDVEAEIIHVCHSEGQQDAVQGKTRGNIPQERTVGLIPFPVYPVPENLSSTTDRSCELDLNRRKITLIYILYNQLQANKDEGISNLFIETHVLFHRYLNSG